MSSLIRSLFGVEPTKFDVFVSYFAGATVLLAGIAILLSVIA